MGQLIDKSLQVGEVLEHCTGGNLSATLHRVSGTGFGEAGRYSCPYLLHATPNAILTRMNPLDQDESCKVAGGDVQIPESEMEKDQKQGPRAADFVRQSQLRKSSAVYNI